MELDSFESKLTVFDHTEISTPVLGLEGCGLVEFETRIPDFSTMVKASRVDTALVLLFSHGDSDSSAMLAGSV